MTEVFRLHFAWTVKDYNNRRAISFIGLEAVCVLETDINSNSPVTSLQQEIKVIRYNSMKI